MVLLSSVSHRPCKMKKVTFCDLPSLCFDTNMASPLAYEKVWFNKQKCDEAEREYFENLAKALPSVCDANVMSPLAYEKVWFNKHKCDVAEREYFENLAKLLVANGFPIPLKRTTSIYNLGLSPVTNLPLNPPIISTPEIKTIVIASGDQQTQFPSIIKDKDKRFKVKDAKQRNKQNKKMVQKKNEENKVSSNNPITKNTLAGEVAKARQHIQSSLECMDGIAALAGNPSVEVNKRILQLEKQNENTITELNALKVLVKKLSLEIVQLKESKTATSAPVPAPVCNKPQQVQNKSNDEDDGIDLFGSDSEEEDAEAKRIREQRLADYANRKSKKPVLIAKSNIILDVKPWDDETNMKELEEHVRKVQCDGLVWGASKLVPLAYGIHKLQISCVVEDEKVSVDWLQETIQEVEDYVQSVDIAAFNKV